MLFLVEFMFYFNNFINFIIRDVNNEIFLIREIIKFNI